MLPGSRQPDVAVAAVVPIEADVQTPGIEVADGDTVTVRVGVRTADVDVLEQTLASLQEVADGCVDHHLSLRCFFEIPEERLLFVPRLIRRVSDRNLADQLPTEFALILRERLIVVPGVVRVVEERALDLRTNVENRQQEHSDKNMRVLRGAKHILTERHFVKIGKMLFPGI